MTRTDLLPALNLTTLGLVLLIAIGAFLYFMRKRSNRHPMDSARGERIKERRREEAVERREEEGRAKLSS